MNDMKICVMICGEQTLLSFGRHKCNMINLIFYRANMTLLHFTCRSYEHKGKHDKKMKSSIYGFINWITPYLCFVRVSLWFSLQYYNNIVAKIIWFIFS